jgi:flagellar assembly protein FliH
MRAAPAKFLFDNDFAAGSSGTPTLGLAEHAAKVKDAEAAAFARGFEQAAAEARADEQERSAAALERIAAAVQGLDRGLAAIEARLETEAVEVALAVARKLAPELIAREPLAEIKALATACFRNLVKTPHIAVRVSDALQPEAHEKLEEIARGCGLDSRLVVLADPDMAAGDCRIEWADGGIVRDVRTLTGTIEAAVEHYVMGRLGSVGGVPGARLPNIQWR